MHNGLFGTLEEVLAFYNLGGGAGMGLEVENQTLSDAPLGLSKQEVADIIAFMETLTDTSNDTTNWN
jgi:cytochrome c peroxidase